MRKHLEKFNSLYEPEPNSGCWLWVGAVDKNGYGTMRIGPRENSKIWFAHRLSYIYNIGDIPEGMQINHKCDNKYCVNPEHLYCGTQRDNMRDTIGKRTFHGYKCNVKLSEEDVLNIRTRYSSGESYIDIHKDYSDLSISTIRAAGRGQNWKDI